MTSRPWHYLIEADAPLRELARLAKSSGDDNDWEAYETALRRVGRPLDAYRSYAARTFPKKGWYILYELLDETFSIQGPYKKRVDPAMGATFRYMNVAGPRRESRVQAVKQGPWVDHDGPEVISGPIYARLLRILRTWAHRANRRESDPADYQLYVRDIDGNVREESL